jgi:hypothetical protein
VDTQIIELIGRHHLTSELLRAGLEVAMPIRDRGIDLIAYVDIDSRLSQFVSCPIQMKAAMGRSFSVAAKYERVRNLLMAYVWNLEDSHNAVTYALTYPEAHAVANKLGWTRTASWAKGAYTTTRPSAQVVELLEPYRMTSERWWKRVTSIGR